MARSGSSPVQAYRRAPTNPKSIGQQPLRQISGTTSLSGNPDISDRNSPFNSWTGRASMAVCAYCNTFRGKPIRQLGDAAKTPTRGQQLPKVAWSTIEMDVIPVIMHLPGHIERHAAIFGQEAQLDDRNGSVFREEVVYVHNSLLIELSYMLSTSGMNHSVPGHTS